MNFLLGRPILRCELLVPGRTSALEERGMTPDLRGGSPLCRVWWGVLAHLCLLPVFHGDLDVCN